MWAGFMRIDQRQTKKCQLFYVTTLYVESPLIPKLKLIECELPSLLYSISNTLIHM